MSGRVFKPGSIVIHKVDLVPTFGLIVDILVFNVDDYYIVYELLETESFSHHYNAYEVSHQMMKEYKAMQTIQIKGQHCTRYVQVRISALCPSQVSHYLNY